MIWRLAGFALQAVILYLLLLVIGKIDCDVEELKEKQEATDRRLKYLNLWVGTSEQEEVKV